MTFEELKAEAKAQGYNLIKIQERINFKPCVCGKNHRSEWCRSDDGVISIFYQCKYCGFTGGNGKNKKEAKIAWNEAVENAERNNICHP